MVVAQKLLEPEFTCPWPGSLYPPKLGQVPLLAPRKPWPVNEMRNEFHLANPPWIVGQVENRFLFRPRGIGRRADDGDMHHDQQPEHDQEGQFLGLVPKPALPQQCTWPTPQERQDMERLFRHATTAVDGAALVPAIGGEADQAHHRDDAKVDDDGVVHNITES